MVDKVEEYREQLIETAVEQDDDLMEAYMEGEEPTIEQIKACIRKGTRTMDFFPTYCGSAFKNKGVQLVLDAVIDYLPAPDEVDPQPLTDEEGVETGEHAIVSADEPLKALAFKIMDDRFGALTFVRIYSGKINKGDTILNSATGKTERVGRMVEMQADERNELTSAQAGDIIAIVGMKNVQTGHTLCDPKHPVILEAMVFPDPVISISVKPKDKGSTEKMGIAIGKMIAEDPSFRVETDEDSGETILSGMGELHLDIKVDILKRTYGVDLIVGEPQVAYRETITQEVEDSYTHKKQSGGSGQFGKIDYRIKPGEPGSGFVFKSTVVGGNVPKEFFPAIEKGFAGMMEQGVLAGFPVLDVEIELYDGGFHAVDSSAVAFELAARGAFRQSIPKAGAQLLEPIMSVDVFTPEDHVGDVIGDLNRRRGMISGQEAGATGVRIKGDVPLSEMFGYIGSLRTMTSGRGQFSMEFKHYMPCPNSVAEAVIEKVKAEKAAAKK
jgi:elongation factor G